jgi:rubrerythrin
METNTHLDSLIRGELAAVKSYDRVLNRIEDQSEKQALSELRQDHIRAVDTLKRYADFDVNESASDAGAWGAFTASFAGAASLFGDKAALSALKKGEEYGVSDYKKVLDEKGINPELRSVIQSELLPQQERHIQRIESYMH